MHTLLFKKTWPGIVALLLAVLLAPRISSAQAWGEVVANDDYDFYTDFATPVVIDVLDNDFSDNEPIDPTSVEITAQPVGGVVVVDPLTGAVLYTPDTTYWGYDSFNYQYQDTSGEVSNEAYVYIEVGEPIPPFADDDYVDTGFREQTTFDLLANDWGIEAPLVPYTVVITAEPGYGSVQNNLDGTVTYTPDPFADNVEDVFLYTVADAYGNFSYDAYVYVAIGENGQPSMTLDTTHLEEDTYRFSGQVFDDQTTDGLLVTLYGDVDPTDVFTRSDGTFSVDLEVDGPFAEVFGIVTDVAFKDSDEIGVFIDE